MTGQVASSQIAQGSGSETNDFPSKGARGIQRVQDTDQRSARRKVRRICREDIGYMTGAVQLEPMFQGDGIGKGKGAMMGAGAVQ